MRLFIVASTFYICLALASCSNAQKPFPDNINVTSTEHLTRIKGTKIFVATPATYTAMESMVRLQRDNDTYLQAIEIPNSNFYEYQSKLTKAAVESQGAKVDIDKPVMYNGYHAIYFVGPSKTDGETKIGLAFGDSTFVMMLMAVCKTSDQSAMDELNKIFSTSYYDKSFDLNPLELATFTFDETITSFKHAATMGNMFIYSPNGKQDMVSQQNIPVMMQLSTIVAPNFSKAKEFLDYTISRYAVQGLETSNLIKREFTINGQEAYEVTMQVTDKDNTKSNVYQVIIHKGSEAVVFLGSDETGKWLGQFKATAQSIQL